MGELVRQHLLQSPRIVQCATHRHPNLSIVEPRCPLGTPRDVSELFIGTQDDSQNLRWIRKECRPDPPIRGLQHLERTCRKRLLGGTFKEHREMRVDGSLKRPVQGHLFAPRFQSVPNLRMLRHPCERGLVRADGALNVARTIRNLPQQQRRLREPGIQSQRLLERSTRPLLLSLEMRCQTSAEKQGCIIGMARNGFLKVPGSLLYLARFDGFPSRPCVGIRRLRVGFSHGSKPRDEDEADACHA